MELDDVRDEPLVCVECGRAPEEGEAALDTWGALSDGLDLHVFCPACLQRQLQRHGAVRIPARELRRIRRWPRGRAR